MPARNLIKHDLRREFNNSPVRFCESCGCILEFRYTEYIPSVNWSLLGFCCINRYCSEFGKVFEPSWSYTLTLSRSGFELRKLGGKKIEQ
jgi:hypothetical protein